MTATDDAELLRLASRRPRDLFPALKRGRALLPLLVVCAVVPSLPVLSGYHFGDEGALWGLKSLAAHQAEDILEFVVPGQSPLTNKLKTHPPLGSWLSAAVMTVIPPSMPAAVTLVSFLSTAGIVLMAYALFQQILGARLAVLTAVLLAFCGPILELAQTPAPYALSLLTLQAAFWGIATHLSTSDDVVSVPLFLAGIALGLCFLSGGTVAVLGVTVLLGSVTAFRKPVKKDKLHHSLPRRIPWGRLEAARAVAIVLLTAFAVSGWWFLMVWNHPELSLEGGLSATESGKVSEAAPAAAETTLGLLARRTAATLSVLSGLFLLGIRSAFREFRRTEDGVRRNALAFLLTWTWIAALFLLLCFRGLPEISDSALPWQGFFLLPAAALAALAIEEIGRSRIRLYGLAFALLISILAVCAGPLLGWFERGQFQHVAWALLLLIGVGIVILWQTAVLCRDSETRQRVVVIAVVVLLIGWHAAWGVQAARNSRIPNRALTALRDRIVENEATAISSVILIAKPPAPPRARFLFESLMPHAELTVVNDWKTAVTSALPPSSDQPLRALIVDWQPEESGPAARSISRGELKELVLPQFTSKIQLRASIVTKNPDPLPN